jgi:hypothetical protein
VLVVEGVGLVITVGEIGNRMLVMVGLVAGCDM